MRLLFARVGILTAGDWLAHREPDRFQMVDRIEEMVEGTRLFLLAPIVRGRKGEYRKSSQSCRSRLPASGRRQMYDIEDAPTLDKNFKHDIEVVVDRIVVRPDSKTSRT